MADSDDEIQLSSSTLSALQEFLREQKEQEERFERLKAKAEELFDPASEEEAERIAEAAVAAVAKAAAAAKAAADKEISDQKDKDDAADAAAEAAMSMDFFKEDWQLSQFWYDEPTSIALAQEALNNADQESVVVCVSAPTAFVKLMNMNPPRKSNVYLFEYDKRFAVYGPQFIHYDYSQPTTFRNSNELAGKVDFIIVDPPFLSNECCDKTLQTVQHLLKPGTGKVVMCTGFVMRERVFANVKARMTVFHPQHQGGLANDFRCYLNYKSEQMPVDETN